MKCSHVTLGSVTISAAHINVPRSQDDFISYPEPSGIAAPRSLRQAHSNPAMYIPWHMQVYISGRVPVKSGIFLFPLIFCFRNRQSLSRGIHQG
ncbi:MAG: hypothetical protein LUQ45_02630, partial [Methanoregulaceae archaeon]|nr:hypothetical protein [Methanoregulaceae archaeon]